MPPPTSAKLGFAEVIVRVTPLGDGAGGFSVMISCACRFWPMTALVTVICPPPGDDPDIASGTLFDGAPLRPFCTITVKLPDTKLAIPLNCVGVLVDSAVVLMLQGIQFGPVKITMALAGSKPVPLIVNVNVCPATGRFGNVTMAVTLGAVVAPDTVSDWPLEGAPLGPLLTVMLKLPEVRVAVPFNCVEVLLVKALLAMVHGVQLGPVKETMALVGSKPVPVIEKENAWPLTGGVGVVVSPLVLGATPVGLDTVRDNPFEGVPVDPFCTVTVKLPGARVALTPNCVEVLFDRALLAMLQGAHPGPVKVTSTLFGSNPVPVTAIVNACPPAGGFGVVASALICGATEFDTVRVRPFEGMPEAFCTVTVKLPAAKVVGPLNCVDVALDNALLGMLHGVHPGPLSTIIALLGSKPDPLTVNVNAFPSTGGLGEVVIPLSWSCAPPAGGATVRASAFEIFPIGPLNTVTEKLPAARIATPFN